MVQMDMWVMPKSSLKHSIFIVENIRRHYDLLTQAYMYLESHSLPLSSLSSSWSSSSQIVILSI